MKEEYEDFGYANSWGETPPEVKKCRDAQHRLFSLTVGRCETEYSCKECKIKWRVDSSD